MNQVLFYKLHNFGSISSRIYNLVNVSGDRCAKNMIQKRNFSLFSKNDKKNFRSITKFNSNNNKHNKHNNYILSSLSSSFESLCLYAFTAKRNIASSSSSSGASASASEGISAQKTQSKRIVQLALFGNAVITTAKGLVWLYTGSSAMLSEAIHSLVDSGNQALLLIGIIESEKLSDNRHQYGYGRSIYFWSLVSALGTFWCGAGVSMWNSVLNLWSPNLAVDMVGWETWTVLSLSFVIDGIVLARTFATLMENKPKHLSFLQYCKTIRDPTTLAVLMEDSAACMGVILAVAGIGATQLSGLVVFDGLAGMSISTLLASMGIYLARLNQKYLLGQAVDQNITAEIKQILSKRPAIDEVHEEQSQWIGPYAFSYKAEVDFDGTYLAAKLLKRYQNEFMNNKDLSSDEVKLLLAWYAEDVMRTVEQEVKDVEEEIRLKFPEAAYIELEPDSRKKTIQYAIDESREASLKEIEIKTINQLQADFLRISRRKIELEKEAEAKATDMAGDREVKKIK